MRLFESRLNARVVSLLAMVILLCAGTFLSLVPTGLEVPAALVKAPSPHVNQGTNGDWHPLDRSSLAVCAEEETDEHPVNAELLSALLLLALSLWATEHAAVANGCWQRAFRFVSLGRSVLTTLEDRLFLSVFRL
jgi:hypothetical protein